jgi:preprotein translocase subunit SecE
MNKITSYIRDSYRELLEKVSWPSWQQLQQTTMIVLGATFFITLLVLLMDTVINSKYGILTLIYKMLS